MKLSSQGTKFYIGTVGAAGAAVSGATKAAPAVLTWATIPPALTEDDVVIPQGFNWKSIDGRIFTLGAITANSAPLVGSDTASEIGAAAMGTLSEVTWAESCMATITISSPAGSTIDVTTLCDVARETIDGMPGISTWSATGFWDAADPMQTTLRALYRSGQKVPIQIIFNDGSGLTFMGTVNQFDLTVGVDQAVAYTVGGNISGPVTDIVPAGLLLVPAAAPAPEQPAA